jgi:hypothetical protein
MLGRFVLVTLVVAVAAGCANDSSQPTPSRDGDGAAVAERPNAAELKWVGDLEDWYAFMFMACADAFDQEVGPAPSDRLRGVGENARAACTSIDSGLHDERQALAAGDDDAIAKANALIRGKQAELEAAIKRARSIVPDIDKALPRIPSPSEVSRIDPYLSHVATLLVGSPAEIRCWSREDWRRLAAYQEAAAFAWEGTAHFATGDCTRLTRLRAATTGGTRQSELLELFAHELEHVGGNEDEDVAECYAVQNMSKVGAGLGLPQRVSRRLQLLYWRELYELNTADYRSDECRDGGALDLDLTSGRWP